MNQHKGTLYQKLCQRFAIFNSSALYQAQDHLLLIEGLAYQRCYRFYFDTIQAIQVRKTKRQLIELGIYLGASALIAFAISLLDFSWASFRLDLILQALFAGPFLLLAILTASTWVLLGSHQQVTVQTPVQRKVLSTLAYTRASKKILNQLVQRIALEQGNFPSAESLQDHLNDWKPAPSSSSQVAIKPLQDLRKIA